MRSRIGIRIIMRDRISIRIRTRVRGRMDIWIIGVGGQACLPTG